MTTFDETIQSLKQDLIDAEADIQSALFSMKSRVTDMKIVTHQRQDRPSPERRPGFFREQLDLPQHIERVQTRADMEHTASSLNHKNWGSVVNGIMEISSGCVEDGNKIAMRVDALKAALRTMHLLQQHLAATARAPPPAPELDKPAQQPEAKTEPKLPDLAPAAPVSIAPADFGTMTTVTASAPPEYRLEDLADIHFADPQDIGTPDAGPEPDQPDEPDRTMSKELDDEDEDQDADE